MRTREQVYLPIILALIEKRIEVLKKRLIKEHGSDWYDLEEYQQIIKMRDIHIEFDNLIYAQEALQEQLDFLKNHRR